MTVEELFHWLREHNAKIAFGFKKSVPYATISIGGMKVKYTREGNLDELGEALIGLVREKVEAESA